MNEVCAYIIDPHVLMRQTIARIINKSEGLSIVGSSGGASVGEAINEISNLKPDVILLGIVKENSPQKQLFKVIRKEFPVLPIVVMTPLNREGAALAISALKEGAVDFITKPAKPANFLLARRHFEKRVVPILRMIPRLNTNLLLEDITTDLESVKGNIEVPTTAKRINQPFELIVVGGCTGGVRALYLLISSLPAELPVPVVIVQHMPKIYTKALAEDLDNYTKLNVREASYDSPLLPGQIYFAPGSKHLIIKNDGTRKKLALHRGPKELKCRPSINVLLRSVSQINPDKVLGVFLSGGGRDGLEGVQYLIESGGLIIVQDFESSLVWDLPRAITKRFKNVKAYPVTVLGSEIVRRLETGEEWTRQSASRKADIASTDSNEMFNYFGL